MLEFIFSREIFVFSLISNSNRVCLILFAFLKIGIQKKNNNIRSTNVDAKQTETIVFRRQLGEPLIPCPGDLL